MLAPRLRIVPAAGLLVGLAVAAEEPSPRIDAQARARLRAARVRIEPTGTADPGQCLRLGPQHLTVRIRGEKIDTPGSIDLVRETPPTVHALVIDTSESMRGELPFARRAAKAYVQRLRPDRERAMVVSFDENVVFWESVTPDKQRLVSAIDALQMGGHTSMLDALYYTMRELDAHRARPVLVLLSDGRDTGSHYTRRDVAELLARRPDLTVFAIDLGKDEPVDVVDRSGRDATRQVLEELAGVTGGMFFRVAQARGLNNVYRRIREILDSEATVTVADPDPGAEPGPIEIVSEHPACSIKLLGAASAQGNRDEERPLRQPFPTLPRTYRFSPSASYLKLSGSGLPPGSGLDCDPTGDPSSGPGWILEARPGRIRVCGPDLAVSPGYLYRPGQAGAAFDLAGAELRMRLIEFAVPPRSELALTPQQALERFAAGLPPPGEHTGVQARPHVESPQLVHGMTFLEMRPRIAEALFLQEGYGEWARARLAGEAKRTLELWADRWRRRLPDEEDAVIAKAVRESEAGVRILTRARSPAPVDLQPLLTARLGDLSAQEVFLRWEADRIAALFAEQGDGDEGSSFVERWTRARAFLFMPSHVRSVTLLVPSYDAGCDCIGFWRIVLPRPGWMHARMPGSGPLMPGPRRPPFDLLPIRPFAFEILAGALAARPDLGRHLRDAGYRVAGITYRPIGRPDPARPGHGSAGLRLVMKLVSPRGGSLRIVAGLGPAEPEPEVRKMKIVARHDDLLERAAPALRGALTQKGDKQ